MKRRSHPKNVTPKRIVITTTPTTTARPSFRISATMNSVALAWAATRNCRRRCRHRRRWPHRQILQKLCCHSRRKKRNVDGPYRGNRNWNDAVVRHQPRPKPTRIMQMTCPNRQTTTVDRNAIRGGTFWCPIISSIGDSLHIIFFYFLSLFYYLLFVFIPFLRRASHCALNQFYFGSFIVAIDVSFSCPFHNSFLY